MRYCETLLNSRHKLVFKVVALPRAMERLCEFGTQALANAVLAFGKADVSDELLFAALARVVEQRLCEFKPQWLSNTA